MDCFFLLVPIKYGSDRGRSFVLLRGCDKIYMIRYNHKCSKMKKVPMKKKREWSPLKYFFFGSHFLFFTEKLILIKGIP